MTEKTLINGTVVDTTVTKEYTYQASSGNSIIIPMGDTWTSLAIMTSGGLDSTLLLYLTAKTIKENNLNIKIRPISIEVPTKAKSLTSARNVIAKVAELLEFDGIEESVEDTVPLDECKQPFKDAFYRKKSTYVLDTDQSQYVLNGVTKNPPEAIRSAFKYDEFRQTERDARTSIYTTQWSAAPLSLVDKKDVMEFYITYGLIDTLAPLTLSCDENMSTIQAFKMPIPCRECWWCSERAWGFTSNGLTVEDAFKYIQ